MKKSKKTLLILIFILGLITIISAAPIAEFIMTTKYVHQVNFILELFCGFKEGFQLVGIIISSSALVIYIFDLKNL